MISVLLVGESWTSATTHYKGFDFFSAVTHEETGADYLRAALEGDPEIRYAHMPSHIAAESFPNDIESLRAYDVIILSDIGANTLLLSRKVFIEGKTQPNRLKLLRQWVQEGGALCMCGGYLSFAGIEAKAKYFRTPIEDVLPVNIYTFDDRVETPEGVSVAIRDPRHPILAGVEGEWPALLGYQETALKPGAQSIVETENGDPLIAVWNCGAGRAMVWTTDVGPHWCPVAFAEWPGYAQIWRNAIRWLAGGDR